MTPLYIFDLDGTLALTHHRQHILDDRSNPHRWRDFFAACVDDQVNVPVYETFNALMKSGAEVRIWSGRSDEARRQTEDWLNAKCYLSPVWMAGNLTMRPAGDTQPDENLKLSWLNALPGRDRGRLVAIFDDRNKVVDMWRKNGVACFQVAPGEF